MFFKKKIWTAFSIIALISTLAWTTTRLSHSKPISQQFSGVTPPQAISDHIDHSRESLRYTAYVGEYRQADIVKSTNANFFNKRIQAVVVNQWHADTPANVSACAAEWKNAETFLPLCSRINTTMIIEVELSSHYVVRKMLIPLPIKDRVSIGDKVSVATGNYDANHENGSLPSVAEIMDLILFDLPSS